MKIKAQIPILVLLASPLMVGVSHLSIGAMKAFPSVPPAEKPHRPLSEAMHRFYDDYDALEVNANELYSKFKYTPLKGLDESISRRDPSKILKINGQYFVWYTHRDTPPCVGPDKATDMLPSYDWDLAEVWYATSDDGVTWREQGVAIRRPPQGQFGWRSVCTPDVLAYDGKYYLYYQAFNEIPGMRGDICPATVSVADSPRGPWKALGKPCVDFGAEDEWDHIAIHDPYPLVYEGKIYLYYKSNLWSSMKGRRRAEMGNGLAIADHPMGPFVKHPLNPVLNSGHETGFFPFQGGIAALVSLNGPELNTIQYAPDGVNFKIAAISEHLPIAPGPFVPDAFADNGDGRGITWGLCHFNTGGGGMSQKSLLARFDCDLSLDHDMPQFKKNNLRPKPEHFFLLPVPAGQRQHIRARDLQQPDSTMGKRQELSHQVAAKGQETDPTVSAAMKRHVVDDSANEFWTRFVYKPIKGLGYEEGTNRRDPSSIIKVGGLYYVWYTHNHDTKSKWLNADLWYATSPDGLNWTERGPAVKRGPEGSWDEFSVFTCNILVAEGKYWLCYQALGMPKNARGMNVVAMSVTDSPDGPWTKLPEPILKTADDGKFKIKDYSRAWDYELIERGSWDSWAVHDPGIIPRWGKYWLYYKGHGIGDTMWADSRWGVAVADRPEGPYVKSEFNPVTNSGHEILQERHRRHRRLGRAGQRHGAVHRRRHQLRSGGRARRRSPGRRRLHRRQV